MQNRKDLIQGTNIVTFSFLFYPSKFITYNFFHHTERNLIFILKEIQLVTHHLREEVPTLPLCKGELEGVERRSLR